MITCRLTASSSPLTLIHVRAGRDKNAVRDYKCKASELENSMDYKITRCIYRRREIKDDNITLERFSWWADGHKYYAVSDYPGSLQDSRSILEGCKGLEKFGEVDLGVSAGGEDFVYYILQCFVHFLVFFADIPEKR